VMIKMLVLMIIAISLSDVTILMLSVFQDLLV